MLLSVNFPCEYLSLLWRKTSLVYSVLKLPKLPITRNPFSVTQTTGTDWNSRKINHCVWSRLITGKSGGRSESLEEKQNNEETLFISQFSNFPWSSCPICWPSVHWQGIRQSCFGKIFPRMSTQIFQLARPLHKTKTIQHHLLVAKCCCICFERMKVLQSWKADKSYDLWPSSYYNLEKQSLDISSKQTKGCEHWAGWMYV